MSNEHMWLPIETCPFNLGKEMIVVLRFQPISVKFSKKIMHTFDRRYLMEKKQKMYMLSKEEFNKLKAAWKKLVDARRVTAKDMLVYNLLRDKRGDRGFVEVLNPRRIKASDPMYAFNEAYNSVWNQTRPKETFLFEKTYAKNQEDFEARYGIAQPVGFREAINSSRLP